MKAAPGRHELNVLPPVCCYLTSWFFRSRAMAQSQVVTTHSPTHGNRDRRAKSISSQYMLIGLLLFPGPQKLTL
jgi:hypothetical protein